MSTPSYQKLALIFASDYYGSNQLYGCINDANDIKKFLLEKRGFTAGNITTVYDKQMTYNGMTKALATLVKQTEALAVKGVTPAVFLYYSGHGMRLAPARDATEDKDGDEVLIPYDFTRGKFLLDDDLNKDFLKKLHPSTQLFIFTDCCNSGTNFDLEYTDAQKQTGSGKIQAKVIHLSGSRDDQTSAEVGGHGIATARFLEVISPKVEDMDTFRAAMADVSIPAHLQNPQVSTSDSALYDGKVFPWLVRDVKSKQYSAKEVRGATRKHLLKSVGALVKAFFSA